MGKDRLMLSHLAYLSNRSYVFHDVMFGNDYDTGVWNPLNTYISGPTAGGPFPPSLEALNTPRAIRRDIWKKHCPDGKRKFLDVKTVNKQLGIDEETEGIVILEKWAEMLRDMKEECVEVNSDSAQLFDFECVYSFFLSPF